MGMAFSVCAKPGLHWVGVHFLLHVIKMCSYRVKAKQRGFTAQVIRRLMNRLTDYTRGTSSSASSFLQVLSAMYCTFTAFNENRSSLMLYIIT